LPNLDPAIQVRPARWVCEVREVCPARQLQVPGAFTCGKRAKRRERKREVIRLQPCSQSIRALDEVFRRLSFGLGDGKAASSSAVVAYGLILNYLDRIVDDRVLPDVFKAESLQGSTWDPLRYPQTALLHRYLSARLDLRPSLLGFLGKDVVQRLRRFWRTNPWRLGVVVRSGFGGYGAKKVWGSIKTAIDSSYPAMVATTRWQAGSAGTLPAAMVACGYRVTAFGQRELLVHTGSYGDFVRGSRARLFYIPLRHVLCAYRFDVALFPSAL
jgi:hypothetical protein